MPNFTPSKPAWASDLPNPPIHCTRWARPASG